MLISKLREKLRPPCRVIDIHVHPLIHKREGDDDTPEKRARELLRAADASGVDVMAINDVGFYGADEDPSEDDLRTINSGTLRVRDAAPNRFIALAYANPAIPEASMAEIERRVKADGVRGVKLWVARPASDPGAIAIARLAGKLNIPLLQHCGYKAMGNRKGESNPYDLAVMAKACPETAIVVAHLNLIGERGVEIIRPHANLYLDVSGGDPQCLLTRIAVERLGKRRVLFGSDVSCRHFGTQLGKVLDAGFDDETIEYILHKNAERLLEGRR